MWMGGAAPPEPGMPQSSTIRRENSVQRWDWVECGMRLIHGRFYWYEKHPGFIVYRLSKWEGDNRRENSEQM